MRSPLVVTSVGIHIAALSGFLVAGFWTLERLEPGRRTLDLAVAAEPEGAPAGSPAAAAPADPFKKKRRTITKDLTQPETADPDAKVEQPSLVPGTGSGTGSGAGSGAGSGSGTGSGSGSGSGSGTCTGPTCGTAAPARVVEPPVFVPPTVIRGLRTSGETQLVPPAVVKTTMLRDGKAKVTATMKLCVGKRGEVESVSVLGSSGYAGYDAVLEDGLRRWRYRPYSVNGRNVRVCGAVTFIYSMK